MPRRKARRIANALLPSRHVASNKGIDINASTSSIANKSHSNKKAGEGNAQCDDQNQEKHNKDSVTGESSGKRIVHGKLPPLESDKGVERGDGGEDGKGREVTEAGHARRVREVRKATEAGEHREHRKCRTGETHSKSGKSKEDKELVGVSSSNDREVRKGAEPHDLCSDDLRNTYPSQHLDRNTNIRHLIELIKMIHAKGQGRPDWLNVPGTMQSSSHPRPSPTTNSSTLLDLAASETPRAIIFSNRKPCAEQWAWNFSRGCSWMSYQRERGTLQCRHIDCDSPMENSLGRGDRDLWYLSSVLVVPSEEEDGFILEEVQGGTVYHNNVTGGGTKVQFLLEDFVCGVSIIAQRLSLCPVEELEYPTKDFSGMSQG
ncbi:hypothetical protein DL95DRAFT_414257 [Leptodontidium sp. 2 PMI_412]|nr:hypothetical protein DL95DRAFT_414257 [Leptodontidium sp. 2 PMI_412]